MNRVTAKLVSLWVNSPKRFAMANAAIDIGLGVLIGLGLAMIFFRV